jgi:hypothetical protein
MADARALNWRFLVPDEPAGMLVLPVDDETADISPPDRVTTQSPIPAARTAADGDHPLRNGAYPAVVALDVAAATRRATRRECRRRLAELAAAVAPGGWLCVGFANAHYPRSPWQRGALTLAAAGRTLRRAGLGPTVVYAALPDHRHPALLVPLTGPEELRFALQYLVPTYEPAGAPHPRARRRLLQAQRSAALAAPPALRAAIVPAYCLLSRRPT